MNLQDIIQTIDGWHRNTVAVSRDGSEPMAIVKSTITPTPELEIKTRKPSDYLKVPLASYDEGAQILNKLYQHYNYNPRPHDASKDSDIKNHDNLILLIYK